MKQNIEIIMLKGTSNISKKKKKINSIIDLILLSVKKPDEYFGTNV